MVGICKYWKRAHVLVAATTSLMTLTGCVSYHEYEIDATAARGFDWNGTIRVTEQTRPEIGPFLKVTDRTSVSRIQLIGHRNRNIVILPTNKARSEWVVAKVQDVGSPPDQVLETIIERSPRLKKLEGFLIEEPQEFANFINEQFEVAAHIRNRQFDQVTASQVASHSVFNARRIETTYNLSHDLVVRVVLIDKSGLTVYVEDGRGNPLYSYEPEDLSVIELDADAT